jgi:transposase
MHAWTVTATLGAVSELGDHLRGEGIEVITLESASDYWRIWHAVLEAAGLKVQLVNARAVRNVPGRAKTDRKDAAYIGVSGGATASTWTSSSGWTQQTVSVTT